MAAIWGRPRRPSPFSSLTANTLPGSTNAISRSANSTRRSPSSSMPIIASCCPSCGAQANMPLPMAPSEICTSKICWPNAIFATAAMGGIGYYHVSDTYVALFSHFIPCGVWEAVYILDGRLKNTSDIQPDTLHADTQGQSTPVFGLAHLLGIHLMPRIRNWKDLKL